MISFTIPGRICGKGRPKFVRATGRTYTPAKTANAEAMVRTLAADAMAGQAPLTGPVSLSLTIYFIPAPSWPRKRRAAARWFTGRPDCDNQVKLIGDALNGIAWLDDAQVARLAVERLYTLEGPERVFVEIDEMMLHDPRTVDICARVVPQVFRECEAPLFGRLDAVA